MRYKRGKCLSNNFALLVLTIKFVQLVQSSLNFILKTIGLLYAVSDAIDTKGRNETKMKTDEELKEWAKCHECGRECYCKRIPVNSLIVQSIKTDGKCPDFYSPM